MLTHDEAVDLLSFIAAYDGRRPNATAVPSWVDASARGRWSFDEAVEAVQQHYAESTRMLMPGHITDLVRRKRQQPPPPSELRQLDAATPSDPAHVASVIDQLARHLGWEREITHRAALAVPCPVEWCKATPGEQCSRPSKKSATGRSPANPHPGRVERAAEQQMDQEAQQ